MNISDKFPSEIVINIWKYTSIKSLFIALGISANISKTIRKNLYKLIYKISKHHNSNISIQDSLYSNYTQKDSNKFKLSYGERILYCDMDRMCNMEDFDINIFTICSNMEFKLYNFFVIKDVDDGEYSPEYYGYGRQLKSNYYVLRSSYDIKYLFVLCHKIKELYKLDDDDCNYIINGDSGLTPNKLILKILRYMSTITYNN